MNNVGREPGNLLLRPASLAYRWDVVAAPGQVMDTVPFRGTGGSSLGSVFQERDDPVTRARYL